MRENPKISIRRGEGFLKNRGWFAKKPSKILKNPVVKWGGVEKPFHFKNGLTHVTPPPLLPSSLIPGGKTLPFQKWIDTLF